MGGRIVYNLGDFVLDSGRRALSHHGEAVPVGDRALSVLGILAERAGEVVSKEELLAAAWPDVAVGEESLTRAVSDLRAALGDSAAEPRYIRTVHRRGYVLVADAQPAERLDMEARETARGRRRLRRPVALAAVIAAVLLAVGLGAFMLDRGDGQATLRLDEWEPVELAGLPLEMFKPTFSPRGGLLVAVGADKETGLHSLFLVRPRTGPPRQLTRGIEVRGPAPTFAADGNHVYFTTFGTSVGRGRTAEVWEVPVLGGALRRLLVDATAVSPSPDGSARAVARVSPEGTVIEVERFDGPTARVAEEGYWPRWSPDGRWIAYTTSDPEGGDGFLWAVRPDGSDRRRLTGDPEQQYGLTWAPDSRTIVFASGVAGVSELWSVDIDDPVRRVRLTRGPGACTAPAFAPDGSEIAFASTRVTAAVLRADARSSRGETILRETGVLDIAVSPDGDRLAVLDGREGATRVSVLTDGTGERRTITTLPMLTVGWMPDGRSLVAVGPSPDRASRWVWRVPLDGSPPKPLLRVAERWTEAEMSPAGSDLAVVREKGGVSELVVVRLADQQERVLARMESILGVRWSPHGRRLAFSGGLRPTAIDDGGIWLVEPGTGDPRRLAARGAWPVWDPAGEAVLFADELDHAGIWRVTVDGGPPVRVRGGIDELPGSEILGLDLAPSGALYILTSDSSTSLHALRPPSAR